MAEKRKKSLSSSHPAGRRFISPGFNGSGRHPEPLSVTRARPSRPPPLFNLAEAGDRREEMSEAGGGALLRLTRGAAGFTGPSPLPVSVLAREEEASPASLMREVVAAPQHRSARQPESFLPPAWKFERELM